MVRSFFAKLISVYLCLNLLVPSLLYPLSISARFAYAAEVEEQDIGSYEAPQEEQPPADDWWSSGESDDSWDPDPADVPIEDTSWQSEPAIDTAGYDYYDYYDSAPVAEVEPAQVAQEPSPVVEYPTVENDPAMDVVDNIQVEFPDVEYDPVFDEVESPQVEFPDVEYDPVFDAAIIEAEANDLANSYQQDFPNVENDPAFDSYNSWDSESQPDPADVPIEDTSWQSEPAGQASAEPTSEPSATPAQCSCNNDYDVCVGVEYYDTCGNLSCYGRRADSACGITLPASPEPSLEEPTPETVVTCGGRSVGETWEGACTLDGQRTYLRCGEDGSISASQVEDASCAPAPIVVDPATQAQAVDAYQEASADLIEGDVYGYIQRREEEDPVGSSVPYVIASAPDVAGQTATNAWGDAGQTVNNATAPVGNFFSGLFAPSTDTQDLVNQADEVKKQQNAQDGEQLGYPTSFAGSSPDLIASEVAPYFGLPKTAALEEVRDKINDTINALGGNIDGDPLSDNFSLSVPQSCVNSDTVAELGLTSCSPARGDPDAAFNAIKAVVEALDPTAILSIAPTFFALEEKKAEIEQLQDEAGIFERLSQLTGKPEISYDPRTRMALYADTPGLVNAQDFLTEVVEEDRKLNPDSVLTQEQIDARNAYEEQMRGYIDEENRATGDALITLYMTLAGGKVVEGAGKSIVTGAKWAGDKIPIGQALDSVGSTSVVQKTTGFISDAYDSTLGKLFGQGAEQGAKDAEEGAARTVAREGEEAVGRAGVDAGEGAAREGGQGASELADDARRAAPDEGARAPEGGTEPRAGEEPREPTGNDASVGDTNRIVDGGTGANEPEVFTKYADRGTSAERFGEFYDPGGEDEFNALRKLYEADPDKVAKPITLIEKDGKVIGYEMEKVPGMDAEAYVRKNGALPDNIKTQIREAVDNFHENGAAHGDLGPRNVMITPEGKVKIIDPVSYTDFKPEYAADDLSRLDGWINKDSWAPTNAGGVGDDAAKSLDKVLADGDPVWAGADGVDLTCNSPCNIFGSLVNKAKGLTGEAVEVTPADTRQVLNLLEGVQSDVRSGRITDDVKTFWASIVRDSSGRWSQYNKSNTSYFYGTQPVPDLTNATQRQLIEATINQQKSFLRGLDSGEFNEDFLLWLQKLHKLQAYKGEGGKFSRGVAISEGSHTNIVKNEVMPIAQKYSDPYSIKTDLQSPRLPGISDSALPTDQWTSRGIVVHYYPDTRYNFQYSKQMRTTLEQIGEALPKGATEDTISLISQYYQYGINSRMFEQVNQTLFANQVNAMLQRLGLNPVEHGILDFVAMRLQPENFNKYFIDEVRRANAMAIIPQRAPSVPVSVAPAKLDNGRWVGGVSNPVDDITYGYKMGDSIRVRGSDGTILDWKIYRIDPDSGAVIVHKKIGESTYEKRITTKDVYELNGQSPSRSVDDGAVQPLPQQVTIQNAQSFDDLYAAIRNAGGIQGSSGTYSPRELKELIEGVRSGKISIEYITRGRGLRDKVQQLLNRRSMIIDSPSNVVASVKKYIARLFNLKVYAQDTENLIIQNPDDVKRLLTQNEFKFIKSKKEIKHQLELNQKTTSEEIKEILSNNVNLEPQGVKDGNRIIVTTGSNGMANFEINEGVYLLDSLPINNVDITIPTYLRTTRGTSILGIGVNEGSGQIKKIDLSENGSVTENSEKTSTLRIVVFYDSNKNGILDSGEKAVPWAGVGLILKKIDQQQTVKLLSGWNLVTLTALPEKPVTASTFLGEIATQDGYATTLSTLDNGVWKTFVVRGDNQYSGDDFAIEVGKAYFVKSLKKSTLTYVGQAFVAPVKINLTQGWNAVGMPYQSKAYKASTLTDELNKIDAKTERLGRFESGLWDVFAKQEDQEYGKNFDVMPNRGYIIKMESGGEFTP
ncbi:MAG: hypothetical protein A3D24_01470 [Candidatus Blackburnbacteria bacterium RIFCSPHIGHO2_02_FULL_39_13]|nr:MAG: hypothetical protein A2694_02545 [Candidatus Blackburnbacteria bacterium RIFCSPHIGHO2_01_FULL_40_17]OGY08714.1 MAG: hypothetical protein A3D24_01470 [Candidatus Blackburnbacteria bacterium RIFCSPHIGHO2_02_FULL_39_13]